MVFINADRYNCILLHGVFLHREGCPCFLLCSCPRYRENRGAVTRRIARSKEQDPCFSVNRTQEHGTKQHEPETVNEITNMR